MEATKSRRKPSKRKPFTDLTNAAPSSLPSSIKPPTKSSHSLSLKSLFNDNPNAHLNSNSNFTATGSPINDNVNSKKNKEDTVKGPSNEANPSSTLSPPPKTPSVSVYKRRQTAEKGRPKGRGLWNLPVALLKQECQT
ncbi:uncharacterized protein LOC120217935 isoform X2 [Hibiscus syriacus]|uniref:uncharacterized protein LOC120217935 isoform X2 n=1 Tax=Hibiscus syriacus TaxID=106335 RepID=UPI001920FED1|nr:uncharacterized protein LOC120217935 isoform X2 [Hibiscus syriacus]